MLCAMKKEKPSNIVIGLDHNLDFLKSVKHGPTNDFIEANLDFGMIPTVTRPTRITKTTATLIDNILVSQNLCGTYVSNLLVNDISDHLPSICVLKNLTTSKKEPIVVKTRDKRVKNMTRLRENLVTHNWNNEIMNQSVSANMSNVHQSLVEIIDTCTPYTERKIKYKQLRRDPWMTSGIKLSIDKNKRNYSKKQSYYQDRCYEYKTQTKKLWCMINEIASKTNDKSSLIDYLKIDGIKEYNANTISNGFANYFANVGKKFANQIPDPGKHVNEYLKKLQSSSKSIFMHPTNEQEVLKIV